MLALLGVVLITLPGAEEARASPEAPGELRLWIAPVDAELELRTAAHRGAKVVCRAPCGVLIDPTRGERFVIAGTYLVPSAPLELADYAGDVTAVVRGGSTWARGGGLLALLGGLIVAVIASEREYHDYARPLVASSVVLGVAGIGLIATSSTTYELHQGRR